MNISMADKETMASLLDQLGESTGGYFFYYDFAEHLLHVSRNVVRADHLFSMSQPVCTLSQWRKKINPHDLDRVIRVNDDLVSRNIRNFSINYRVVDSQGQSFWVNSCCGSYFGEQGTLSYVLGRLTVNLPPQDGNPESSLALKSEVRKLLAALQPGYLLLVGVDNLKSINIRDGRNFGDAVLEDVTRVMEDETDHKQQVYRVNGDFFALNLPDFTVEQVRGFFGRVQERLAGQCTISGGAVPYTRYHVADENILLQYAETALDCSKRQGKNLLTFFTPESYEKKLRELELREDLQSSIEAGFRGFEAFLQPQFRTENLSLYGAEVLLRYCSPRLGSVSMNEVIPVLEQSGLICPVGLWVLRQALRLCRRWRETFPEFHISVNMSYRQLEQASIAEDVLDLVNSSGVPGSALTIEVTESMELVDYPQLNQLFCRWRRYGIQISVDDFGTGYSSLGRLKDMEIDEIKIDRCFVTNVQNSAYNYRLLNNILDLADTSSVRTCCEGVETVEELHVLRELRCSLVQGYLFAKPCPEASFEEKFLTRGKETLAQITSLLPRLELPVACKDAATDQELTQTILDAEDSFVYLCDLETHSLYYLNAAGQKLFGVRDYRGKPCYKVLRGRNTPCPFCNNGQLLQNTFSVWEQENPYCQRHFLLKDRIINYRGRKARLEVGLDITRGELVSQAAQERLDFAEKIVGYMNTLADNENYEEAVNRVLASVGDFYQADRAYLFQPSAVRAGYWCNTFEWCAVNVTPQMDRLQEVSQEELSRWLELFDRDQSLILFSLDPLRTAYPREWETLHAQGIQRIIAVPLRQNDRTIAFVGVDNPRYCIHDDAQIRVLAGFLLARMRQDQNERRYRSLLMSGNQDLLHSLRAGFWTLKIRKADGDRELTLDSTLGELLALPEFFSSRETYHFWISRIPAQARPAVEEGLQQMIRTGKLVRVAYPWEHDRLGRINLRASGLLIEDTRTLLRLTGYCQQVSAPAEQETREHSYEGAEEANHDR